jgi:hypothetical protein
MDRTLAYDNMMLDLYAKLRGVDAGKDFDCTGLGAGADRRDHQASKPARA